jgi:hypothetical protein
MRGSKWTDHPLIADFSSVEHPAQQYRLSFLNSSRYTQGLRCGEQNHPLRFSRTCIMKLKDFLRFAILIVALAAFGISSGLAADKDDAKHARKITKATAERIALTKVPGGRIHSAELETARGRRFWSVYVAKPGSKNAKEIRVDATSGQILAVQTEKPEDQAEEPPKTP